MKENGLTPGNEGTNHVESWRHVTLFVAIAIAIFLLCVVLFHIIGGS